MADETVDPKFVDKLVVGGVTLAIVVVAASLLGIGYMLGRR